MIDLEINEIEDAILQSLDRAIDRAGETRDDNFWRGLAELVAFDASMAEDGVTFGTAALVAERLGRTLIGLPLIDHLVAMRALEQAGGDAATFVAALRRDGDLLGILDTPERLVGGAGAVSPSGAAAVCLLALKPDGVALYRNAPGGGWPNLGDLPMGGASTSDPLLTNADPDLARLARAERKVLAAAAMAGIALHAVELAADYAKERTLFGGPIGAFQSLAHGMASGRVQADAMSLLAREAAWARDGDPDRFETLAAMAYGYAATASVEAARFAVHVFGGYGVTREYPVQSYFRAAKALSLAIGDPLLDLRRIGALVAAQGSGSGPVRVEL